MNLLNTQGPLAVDDHLCCLSSDRRKVGVLDDLLLMISDAAKVSNLSHQELEKLKPITLSKASDIAVLNRRNSIIKDDLHTLNLWHRSFVCFKSFFLANPTLAAALVTSADQQLLESIGFSTIEQLSATSTREILEKAIAHVK